MDKCVHMLPQTEKAAVLSANLIDLQWISERSNGIWTVGQAEDPLKMSPLFLSSWSVADHFDPWATLLFGFMEKPNVLHHCPSAVAQAWPICYQRVTGLFTVIDPT